MSTENSLVVQPVHKALAGIGGGGIPQIIPQTMDEVWRFAQVMSKSGILPKGIETPEQVTVQILTGFELNLKPMVAVQNIGVINGKPSIGGDLALAILMQSGLLVDHDERIEGEGDDRFAVCKVERQGMKPIERRFSVRDAKKAGLWQTQATIRKTYWDKNLKQRVESKFDTENDSPWWRYPDRMLCMRARGFAFRDRFSDVLKGMHLTEEMLDAHQDEARPALPREEPPAPPPEVAAEITHQPEPEKPAQRQDPVQDAEIVEEKPAASQEQLAQPAVDPGKLIVEIADAYALCKTTSDVDDVHGQYEDLIEEHLSRRQREEVSEWHQAAIDRVEVAKATPEPEPVQETAPAAAAPEEPPAPPTEDDEEQPPAPEPEEERSPAEIHYDHMMGMTEGPNVTSESMKLAWNDTIEQRKEMIAKGEMTKEFRAHLKEQFWNALTEAWTAEKALREQQDQQSAAPATESAAADQSEPAGKGEKAAFTDRFRKRLEECETVDQVNAYSTETLPERNRLLGPEGDSIHHTLWRTMVTQRRNALNGL